MSKNVRALAAGAVVERFTIERLLAAAPGCLNYIASDGRGGGRFVLQEFWPATGAGRHEHGHLMAPDGVDADRFALEMSTAVARFLADSVQDASLNHAVLVSASRTFKANGTAYRVYAFGAGQTLQQAIEAGQCCSYDQAAGWLRPLLDALELVHQEGRVHGALMPQTIMLDEAGAPRVLGLGHTAGRGRADAFAAIEQTGADEQGAEIGPWTDIYGLAATLYHAINGVPPATARQRQQAVQGGDADPLVISAPAPGSPVAEREITVLMQRGLALAAAARPQSIAEWRARITRTPGEEDVVTAPPAADEGRQWLPRTLLAVLLAAIAVAGYYVLTHRAQPAPAAPPEPPVIAPVPQETLRWQQALEADAVVGYRDFINDFPQSRHIPEALEHIGRLEDLAWLEAQAEHTQAGYQAHLDRFPDGRHATEARALIEEFRQVELRAERERAERQRQDDLAWEKARGSGTLAALDDYIAAWPGGLHVQQARQMRQRLQGDSNDAASFEAAAKAHTIEAYRNYISAYPAGRHVTAAQQAIDELTLRPSKVFRDCADCPDMVVVPAGSFWQGSADASPLAMNLEKPRRRVTIAEPFAVGVHEVTMAQWDACVAAGGCDTRPADNGWGRGTRPVIMVSWNDAMQYVNWLNQTTGQDYSLPSESEWEYVARAGEETDWLGGDAAAVCAFGNIAANETGFDWRHTQCADTSALETAPVGSFRPNAFGVYDVVGNVAEWTLDCMNLSYLDAPADGSAWTRGLCGSRMTRGGSWFTGSRESRLPARFNLKNGDRNDFTGFRVVRRVEKQ